MMNKSQIARHFGVKPAAIVKWGEVDGGANYRVLIDYGIGGIKVYTEPVEAFKKPAPKPEPSIPAPEPEPLPVPVVVDMNAPTPELAKGVHIDVDALSYTGLQKEAKLAGIPANQSAQALRDALQAAENEEL